MIYVHGLVSIKMEIHDQNCSFYPQSLVLLLSSDRIQYAVLSKKAMKYMLEGQNPCKFEKISHSELQLSLQWFSNE